MVLPLVLVKGSVSSKPSVARLLGIAPRSDAMAVERQRPLEPERTDLETHAEASRAAFRAVAGATSLPLMAMAILALASLRPRGEERRIWTLIAVIGLASFLALVRLHATGGYCAPRHAMLLAALLIPASLRGIEILAQAVPHPLVRRFALPVVLAALFLQLAPDTFAPVNPGLGGYKRAGLWLRSRVGDSEKVVDVTGWSQFFSTHEGYTFANLFEALDDPDARWVVVRESHLIGPWWYCRALGQLVEGRAPVQEFRSEVSGRSTRVLVFDRTPRITEYAPSQEASARR
jgi:hypothetical protein